MACLSPLHDWYAGWDHITNGHGGGQDVPRFQRTDISLTGRHDLPEAVEQVWIEAPPPIRSAEIADVPTVLVMVFIWVEPPCNTKTVSW